MLAVRPIREIDRFLREFFRLAVANGQRNRDARVVEEHPALFLRDTQEPRVAAAEVIGNIDCRHHRAGVIRHAFLPVIKWKEFAVRVRQVQQRIDCLEQHAILVLEYLQFGPRIVETLCKYQERQHGVALIVGTLGVIAIRRKWILEVCKEACSAFFIKNEAPIVVLRGRVNIIERDTVERPLDQLIVIHDETNHADCRGSPGAVVVYPVEELRVLDGNEVGKRPEQVPLQLLAFLGGQPIVNRVVGLGHVEQPVAVIQALPEELPPSIGPLLRMNRKMFVHCLVLQKHVADVDCIVLVPEDLEKRARLMGHCEISLVALVRIAAREILRYRRVYSEFDLGVDFGFRCSHSRIEQGNTTECLANTLDTVPGHDQVGMFRRLRY